ncbi:MAG: putative baseplate assembly protein [Anaerolineae bacterium]
MHLPTPQLDDRTFQQLVDEAKRAIPRYCPQWTDQNVSDPGVTLIELFAYMTEQYLFRLNQAPDKNFITFLDLIGVRLQPATPAKGDVRFSLSSKAEPNRRIVIPMWTEVATQRTESEEAVVFTTVTEAEVRPATLRWILTTEDNVEFADHSEAELGETQARKVEKPFPVWSASPAAPQAFYLGILEDLSAHTLLVSVACKTTEGIGIDPKKPPWNWEVWAGERTGWKSVQPAVDDTAGLNQSGEITFLLPYDLRPHRIDNREAGTWLRCSPAATLLPGEKPYTLSPHIRWVDTYTLGITVPVVQAEPVSDEVLGVSNGLPGQCFCLQRPNVLQPEGGDEVVEVETSPGQSDWAAWERVSDFGDSCKDDKHYTLDPASGLVEFGPVVRQPQGTEPQFGAIPPQNCRIRIRRYRVGGGVRGNVAAGKVTELKTTLPYVQSVVNDATLTGGTEAQDLEDAKLRAPQRLRTRMRAVTPDDFENLARDVEGVGRVRCLQAREGEPAAPPPGVVRLLVIPSFLPSTEMQLQRMIDEHEALRTQTKRLAVEKSLQEQLLLQPETEARLRAYLDDRRLLTTRLDIRAPQYTWIYVTTRIKARPPADPSRVQRDVKAALYTFLHPIYGGFEGEGWPFGRPLTIDKVYARIQAVPGVEYATELKLYPIDWSDPLGAQRLGRETQIIDIAPDAVLVSYFHDVTLIR